MWFGRARKLDGIISPANKKWHNPDTPKYSYDPESARQMLISQGFSYDASGRLLDPQKNRVEFEFIVADGSQNATAMSTTFVENMRAIGIEVRLKFMDFGTMISKIDNTFEYEAASWGLPAAATPRAARPSTAPTAFCTSGIPAKVARHRVGKARRRNNGRPGGRIRPRQAQGARRRNAKHIFEGASPLFLVTPMSYSGVSEKWRNVRVPPVGSVIWNIDELYAPGESGGGGK